MSTLLVASRIGAALSHRTWVIEPAARCHLFLLQSGRAALAWPQQPEVEITAPAMLWLPHRVRGTLQIMAGGDGFGASVALEFMQRTVGDAALTVHLRPLLDQVVLAGPDTLVPQLGLLSGSFAALVEESHGTRPAATAMTGLHLAILLLLLWRCSGVHQAGSPRGAGATTAQRFRQLVELHYREGLCIDEFASRLGVTRAHLHDACLRTTGRTPLVLLHDRLLAEARTRLEQTDLPVEQVGYGIGFHDPSYFNRFFKRLTGQSPGAYRRSAAARPTAAVPSFAAWP
ncbi:MAG: AraC family transcriptional regulator [Pseudomonadota bacterium]|nr:AraC family transcriptional regulator [Pseudomonadota bacterium]